MLWPFSVMTAPESVKCKRYLTTLFALRNANNCTRYLEFKLIKSENMKIFHLNNSVNSWMDFFYLFADSHKYSIPDLEKIRYQPSLFCIYKKLITQRSIHRTLSRICPQWHETHPTTYIWLALTTYSGTGWC